MSAFSGKVLLAVDGSPESIRAARMAAKLSRSLGSELHVVHVGPVPEEYIDPYLWTSEPELWDMMRERAEEEAKPKLNEPVQEIREAGGEVSEVYARVGRPDAEIVALAEELGAGLVIVGSRGRGPLKRALMGSVSHSVVRHAHCSVLVVRGNGREGDYLPGRILLALDGSKEARAAARAAVEISTATDSELHVLSVTGDAPLGPYTPYPGPEAWEVSEDVLRARKEKAQAFLRRQVEQIEAAGGAVEEAHLAVGAPAKEIVRTGEELGVGLSVVGNRGLGTVGRTLIGSVSDFVVCHAACPVLVVREEGPVTRAGGG